MQAFEKILVVDDDPAARDFVTDALADAGLACIAAGSGEDALEALARHPDVAVVVTDVLMPGIDGVRLGRLIRERHEDRRWLQMVFVTGQARVEVAVSALRLRALDYLTKPVDPQALVRAVSRALAASAAVQRAEAAGTSVGREVRAPGTATGAAGSALECLAKLRRLRHESGLLGTLDGSAWSMLLEVYHADVTGRRLSVSRLCALDEASPTTAWRRIRALEQANLLARDHDPGDGRRSFVTLTQAAVSALSDYIARADRLMSGTA